jgi:hypothetical protein
LVANGIGDVMVPAENSFVIARHAPNAKLVLYPRSGHGFFVPVRRGLRRRSRAVPERVNLDLGRLPTTARGTLRECHPPLVHGCDRGNCGNFALSSDHALVKWSALEGLPGAARTTVAMTP